MWKFPYQQQPKSVDVFVDADFAARESNAEIHVWSCGVLRESADRVCIHTEHRSRGVLRNHEVLSAQLAQAGPLVLSDANAGIGIASRQGCGRLKHLEVKWLWCRRKSQRKRCDFASIRQKPTLLILPRSTWHDPEWICCCSQAISSCAEKGRRPCIHRDESEVSTS